MTSPPPATRRAARLGTCGLVLASTVFGTVLVPAAAQAAPSSSVTASLRTTVVTDAVTDAVFTFQNTGSTPAASAVEFDLPTGMVHNRLGARVDVQTDGTHVRIAPSGVLEPGATFEVPLFLLNAAGTLPEHCSVDGAAVTGCTADDATETPGSETPGTETPGSETPGAETPGTETPGTADEDDSPSPAPEHTWPTVTSGHTDVPVRPLGSALAAQEHDGTQAARSDLRQAGRWIRAHQTFVVEVPAGVTDAEVAIGQQGNYFGINGCRDVGIATQALHPGQNTVTAPHDGLVSIIDRSTSDDGTIVVRGGAPVPTYVAGVTDRADFDAQLRDWDRSPFFSLIGEQVQADVLRSDRTAPQSDQNEALIADDDLDVRIDRWDETVRTNQRVWGVADTGHRVHITTPSYGDAGANTPTNVHQGWVAFPTDHASPHALFTSDGSAAGEQALRAAFGRVFQQDVMRWTNEHGQADGTISQDLASIVLEEQVHQRNPLDSWRAKVDRFRQQPVGERDFWSNQMNSMTRHLVFDQLRRAYGEDFLSTVAARARADVAAGSDREARRAFILHATHVAGHDLTPFFEQWGVRVEDDLRPHLAEYPALETPIWDDFDALD
ncbi:hypothetical protein E9228_001180 [Curtobacterium flaccumfaciens]|uniref:Peptidase M60 domain-containing protein n=1 Tax=Curtobacterium salicis TaxID=1779862 RepID=A0ABX0T627_9MICO|nr:M60 family metallopeptidase [Curtobacterium sp. WW7]NII40544.1 hypothetical protein [Curtobacterium sp. WW7]